ncbi:CinA family protein [Rhodococcus sp. 24CO]|uniref:CinA family protein n=1 Tax=Rhodococcus sp. 24CO TaxID=3117460 RepID=UPI003D33F9DF
MGGGGVVAYSRAVKRSLLHVRDGPVVCEESVRVMARSAATLMDATLAISVSGEGEPETIVSASVEHAIGVLLLHATAITTHELNPADRRKLIGVAIG